MKPRRQPPLRRSADAASKPAPAPAAKPKAIAAPSRLRPDEWRGTKRNAAINDAIVSKFKVLSARGKTLTQIADRLGISIGRARNISAEIRLGKK